MSTRVESAPPAGDTPFFAAASIAMTVVVVVGFGSWGLRGMVDYGMLPPLVHLHALAFAGWMALHLTQSVLAARGAMARHRLLGWFGAGLAVAIVALGMIATGDAIRRASYPPFFEAGAFLTMSLLQLSAFAGMIAAAIALRRRTEWHRRLMLGATAILTEAAFGRLLPLPFMGEAKFWALAGSGLLVIAAGAGYDLVTRGRIHPAYGAVFGAFLLSVVLIHPFADSAIGIALLHAFQR